MTKIAPCFHRSGFSLRLARAEDAEDYYRSGFCPMDPELVYLTGSRSDFTREEVISFFLKCTEDPDRFDFLLRSPEDQILGECVLNEIDWKQRCANFRIAIFHPGYRNLGLGTWATECIRDYAFETLKLNRVELEVFSFNPRAKRVYEKAGFFLEQVFRDEELAADVILMAIDETKWRRLAP